MRIVNVVYCLSSWSLSYWINKLLQDFSRVHNTHNSVSLEWTWNIQFLDIPNNLRNSSKERIRGQVKWMNSWRVCNCILIKWIVGNVTWKLNLLTWNSKNKLIWIGLIIDKHKSSSNIKTLRSIVLIPHSNKINFCPYWV